ncbi:hypothetical protein HYALB_00008231 [Hymenoscyphus albidus]|uniref:Uncharacterized protein n=1 Tax=Hymenoscyphus albidus TaxID=595503 RepID=A0A9N9LMG6_9HELO|nr:hypothetical protein HYALB_00008231 [Hymenoscyphus albidus]
MDRGKSNIFIPQVVVNGLACGTGGGTDDVTACRICKSMSCDIIVDTDDVELWVDSDLPQAERACDVVFVGCDPTPKIVKVEKGTIKGRKIEHRHVVWNEKKIGELTGINLTLPLPEVVLKGGHFGTEMVAIVQARLEGPMVASQRV